MLLKIYEDNPSERQIMKVVDLLNAGHLIIIPTDSVYSIACNMNSRKAVENLAQLKGIKLKDADFSFIFSDLTGVSEYTKPISNHVFKLIKRNLPGPFTFILDAGNNIPNFFRKSKKTIGVRIPDNNIVREIVRELGNPILTTSVHADDEVREYMTDPSLIHEKYMHTVEAVIDGGYGNIDASTIVDFTSGEPEIIRDGVKEFEF
jgi:tRNA threonylcarbamoyl adenosine modification protein (Sua5/YciO/YrdC/YwlC family)